MTRLFTALLVSAGSLGALGCQSLLHVGDLPQETDSGTSAGGSDAVASTSTGTAPETPTGEEDPEDASSGEPIDDDSSDVDDHLDEAKANFPTYLDLYENVIERSCSPFQNICHRNKEFPDMSVPEGLLNNINGLCGVDDLNESPASMYDPCEPIGDTLRFVDGGNAGHEVEIGRVEINDDGTARVFVRDPMPGAMSAEDMPESVAIDRTIDGVQETVGTLTNAIAYANGALFVDVLNTPDAPANTELLEVLMPGDPNGNGVFGGSTDGALKLITAGDPQNSYLLRRLQGTVPGTPMPLANTQLNTAEMIAVACWIEGTADEGGAELLSPIDYDNCDYASELLMPQEEEPPTLSDDVQPIFDQGCTAPGCHSGARPAAELDLTEGNARASLVDVTSTQDPNTPRVTPLNPTNSYLMRKLTGAGVSGERMPLDAEPLSDSEIETVRTWILMGSPDN